MLVRRWRSGYWISEWSLNPYLTHLLLLTLTRILFPYYLLSYSLLFHFLQTTTVSDSLLRECPSVVLRTRDVDWSQSLRGWLQTQRLAIDMQGVSTSNLLRSDFDSVEQLCLRYAADSLQWLKDNGVLAESSATANIFPLNVCATGLTKSFTTILDVRPLYYIIVV